jgi:hypothetical protein
MSLGCHFYYLLLRRRSGPFTAVCCVLWGGGVERWGLMRDELQVLRAPSPSPKRQAPRTWTYYLLYIIHCTLYVMSCLAWFWFWL